MNRKFLNVAITMVSFGLSVVLLSIGHHPAPHWREFLALIVAIFTGVWANKTRFGSL